MCCRVISFFFTIFLLFFVGSATGFAAEVRYTTHIKPLIEEFCSGCHGKDSPELPEFDKDKVKYKEMMKGPRMDSYTYLVSLISWPDTGAIMRRLDDGKNVMDGKPGNMYQYLGSSEEHRQKNLSLFKQWVGEWTLKRPNQVTREELERIRVPY